MKIFLVGYRCAGKSSIAGLLAKRLQRDSCDLDSLIEEKAECGIEEIVKKGGWEFFRKLEKECLGEVLKRDVSVVATGGGVVLSNENIRLMGANGFVVYLKVKPETVLSRMKMDSLKGKSRPALTEKSLEEEIRTGLLERESLYKGASHMEMDTDYFSMEEICDEIFARLPKEVF